MTSPNDDLQLADEFVLETGCNIFLTGKAGTGKTTFLHKIKHICRKRLVVAAPTGVAAINAGGVTLHSFFQLPFSPFVPGSESAHQHRFNREKINIIKALDLLVVDEISMVRADTLDAVDAVLRRYRSNNLPFGGVQLLLIGDLYQLSPVVKDADWRFLHDYYDSAYFFSSKALGKTELITIELQHIYRQNDGHFIEILNRVRAGNMDGDTLSRLNARHISGFVDEKSEGYITLCTHNNRADSINHSRLNQLKTKGFHFDALIEGEFPPKSFPTVMRLEVKVSAQVMFIRNDPSPEKKFFNGKIGKITRISDKAIWVQCPGEDEIMVEPACWENIEYSLNRQTIEITENKAGSFTQFPLKLAWAITIHKSQGLTFDRAIIDAQAAFAHGQVYVALSRCRTIEGMILSTKLSNQAVKTDCAVLGFVENSGKAPTTDKLAAEKIRYQKQLLLDCFDFQQLQILLSRLVSLVERSNNLLRITGISDLRGLRQRTVNEICVIGANFRRQLQALFKEDRLPAGDHLVLERIKKASIYFQDKFITGIAEYCPKMQVETDNKEIRKKARNLCKYLQEETAVKLAGVKSCEGGFSASDYLRAIANASIKVANSGKSHMVSSQAATYSEADISHQELFQSLKQWRAAKAKESGVPHFQILHQKTLVQIAVNLPDSMEALISIKGIGKKLSEKYGQELIGLVLSYREENNIVAVVLPAGPVDADGDHGKQKKKRRVDPEKPSRKISLELFEQGLNLPQIAEQRNLVLSTVEGHLADCVRDGEISVEGLISGDRQRVIEEKFSQSIEQKLSAIKRTLGGDYSYAEIKFVQAHLQRLVNIKTAKK